MPTKIVIDSASDISPDEARALGITVVPLTVTLGGREYMDGVELSPRQFYEKLIECNDIPKTSQVTPYRFEGAVAPLLEGEDDVLVITLSSKLSGTYSAAVQATRDCGARVRVVDSRSVCIGERLLCQYALRLLAQDPTMDAQALGDALDAVKGDVCVMAMLGTLEYLKKGGRISSALAFAGELIGVKPVIAIADGEVALVGRARGSKNASNLLTELLDRRGGIDFSKPFATVYSGLDDSLLQKYLQDHAHLWQGATERVPIHLLGATIGSHAGPGAIGVAFFAKSATRP